MSPAAFSAVAAAFAALASVSLWLVQRRTLRESVRPHLVLTEWRRKQDGTEDNPQDVISFSGIKNVGVGVALHININSFFTDKDDRPEYVMGTERITLISPGEQVRVDGRVRIYWKNIPFEKKGTKILSVKIRIKHWDTLENCYDTEYLLAVLTVDSPAHITDEILPKVALTGRRSFVETALILKLKRGARKIPFIRRFVKFR